MVATKLPVVFLSIIASEEEGSVNCQIANYILDHLDELQDITISELAHKCFVSNSSISRFCRDIGLEDFSELKELLESNRNRLALVDAKASTQDASKRYTELVKSSLDDVVESIDFKAIEELCLDIDTFEDICIFGMLKAESVALNLQNDLLTLGKRTTSKVSFSQQMDYFNEPEVHRLFIIFSFTGVYFDYKFPRSFFTEHRKSKIVFITGTDRITSRQSYDRIISFKSRQDDVSHPYQLQLVASLIAQTYARLMENKA